MIYLLFFTNWQWFLFYFTLATNFFMILDLVIKTVWTMISRFRKRNCSKQQLIFFSSISQNLLSFLFIFCRRNEMVEISFVSFEIELCFNIFQKVFFIVIFQLFDSFLLKSIILSKSSCSFSSKQVQIRNFERIHFLVYCLQQKYNNMSDSQTLSMVNNDSQMRNIVQTDQFKEKSINNDSIIVGDGIQNPKQLRQDALQFLSSYKKIDETFPINSLKESAALRVKQYKQSTYYGQIHNGKKHGFGVMIYKTGRIYQGEWFNQLKKGYGAQKFANGCEYKGQYFNGKAGGTGTYIWPNSQRYDGQWLNGFKHGSGMWRGQKGDSYKGQWKFGKPEGYGVHTWPNGDTYQGQFKECLKHGEGIERFSNGDMYKGRYINGKPSGYGEYYWFNGSYFKGNFVNGLRDGHGFWKRGVGHSDHYDGNYRNDKKWGYGIFTWASGNVYKGNYEADMRNGFGQMCWVNGSYYKGNWVNGIQHGEGQIYIVTEGFKKGIFDNNNIIQVWEEKLNKKNNSTKPRLRIKTQQNTKKNQKRQIIFRSRDNSKFKKNPQMQAKMNSLPDKQAYKVRQHMSLHALEKQRYSQQQKRGDSVFPQQKQFFAYQTAKGASRQRLKSFANGERQGRQLQMKESENGTSMSHHTKDRLLHSSFYLYKLNVRHNMETMKNLKKNENDQSNSKASILFMGKLYPETK